LCGFSGTSFCVKIPAFLHLIDGVFYKDIYPTFEDDMIKSRAKSTYEEWIQRLQHQYLEMNTFFISQNATQKLCKALLLLTMIFDLIIYDFFS
jgi:hypothetical protein